MVEQAEARFGNTYTNTRDLVLFMFDFIKEEVDPEAWIFIGFLSQVQNSLLLWVMACQPSDRDLILP